MEQTPILTRLFHIRIVSLLSFLLIVDFWFASYAVNNIIVRGPSMMIMFAFEVGWHGEHARVLESLILRFYLDWHSTCECCFVEHQICIECD